VDGTQCIGHVSKERGFHCPVIHDLDEAGSAFDIKHVRHPLVEATATRISYVTHDIALNDTNKGWLVYGMNASGKSTLMKATGICVLLAQAGCFVPAKEMILKPFQAVYTRILNQDNLFAGLSSFAVEMSELRDILRNANPYTLVLGDELCAGTESTSAQALIASGIQWLTKRKAKFIFAQQYFRQALQYLTDQKSMVAKHMNGYGYETYGPIPAKPANGYTKLARSLYPYNVAAAKSLLQSHGWSTATPATCLRPGTAANQCGAGIPQGTPLQFNLEFASGSDVLTGMMNSLHTTWAAGGIALTLTSVSYDTVVGDAFSGSTSWDFANWGGGWLYAPDYLPTGEPMFATGSAANTGGFSNATVDAMIKGTLFGGVTLAAYENYTASQVPVIWMPSTVTLVEYRGIKGHDANPLDTFTPELWHH